MMQESLPDNVGMTKSVSDKVDSLLHMDTLDHSGVLESFPPYAHPRLRGVKSAVLGELFHTTYCNSGGQTPTPGSVFSSVWPTWQYC